MRVLFFAHLREITGTGEAELDGGPFTGDTLWRELSGRWPALGGCRATVRLARNGSYAGEDEVFGEGDEVALIPPVSGG